MNIHLDSPLLQLPLKHLDQMNLIMNLLHNALEAAHSSEKKKVTVSSMIRSGIYILEISNSTALLCQGSVKIICLLLFMLQKSKNVTKALARGLFLNLFPNTMGA
ncbi:GHKL domain-containing protein [Priestia aryabhattai]|uniref:GHKL domain-containing protein n=1 Tax=Priestia megaterium TaxID=1404 RepID=UPI0039B86FD7